MKKCSNCLETKSLSEFKNEKRSKDGKTGQCSYCISVKRKIYRDNNKEKIKESLKNYREKNKEKLKEYKGGN